MVYIVTASVATKRFESIERVEKYWFTFFKKFRPKIELGIEEDRVSTWFEFADSLRAREKSEVWPLTEKEATVSGLSRSPAILETSLSHISTDTCPVVTPTCKPHVPQRRRKKNHNDLFSFDLCFVSFLALTAYFTPLQLKKTQVANGLDRKSVV